MYKSFKIHIHNQNYSYPNVVENTVLIDWIDDKEIIIKNKMHGTTFLKSFDNAPKWTTDELLIFKDAFQTFGAICSKFPKKL